MKIIDIKPFIQSIVENEDNNINILGDTNPLFQKLYGRDKTISHYLSTIGNFATDWSLQLIYELLQNADDANNDRAEKSGCIGFFFDENYFLAINNGAPFSNDDLKGFISEGDGKGNRNEKGMTGKYGKGSKLLYNLLLDVTNKSTEEQKKKNLGDDLRGPIIYSWKNLGQIENLKDLDLDIYDSIEESQDKYYPLLTKIIKAHYPSSLGEWGHKKTLFSLKDVKRLSSFLKQQQDFIDFTFFERGSLIFLELGKGQGEKLKKIDQYDIIYTLSNFSSISSNIKTIHFNDKTVSKSRLLSIENGAYRIFFPCVEDKITRPDLVNFYHLLPISNEKHGFKFIINSPEFEKTDNRQSIDWSKRDNHHDSLNEVKKLIINFLENRQNDFAERLSLYKVVIESKVKKDSDEIIRDFFNGLLEEVIKLAPIRNGDFRSSSKVKYKDFDVNIPLSSLCCAWLHHVVTNPEEIDVEKWSLPKTLYELQEEGKLTEWLNSLFNTVNYPPDTAYRKLITELFEEYKDIEEWHEIDIFKTSDSEYYNYKEVKKIGEYFWLDSNSKNIKIVLDDLGDAFYNNASLFDFNFPDFIPEKKTDGYIKYFNERKEDIKSVHLPEIVKFLCNGDDGKCSKIRQDLKVFQNELGAYKCLSELINFENINLPQLISSVQISPNQNNPVLSEFFLNDTELWGKLMDDFGEIQKRLGVFSSSNTQKEYYKDICKIYEKSDEKENLTKDFFLDREGNFLTSEELFISDVLFDTESNDYAKIEGIFETLEIKNKLPYFETLEYLQRLSYDESSFDFIKSSFCEDGVWFSKDILEYFIGLVKDLGAVFFNHFCIKDMDDNFYCLVAHKGDLVQYQSKDKQLNDLLIESPTYFSLPDGVNSKEVGVRVDLEIISELIVEFKGDPTAYKELINTVERSDFPIKESYITGLSQLGINPQEQYSEESFEVKIVNLASQNDDLLDKLKSRLLIDGKELNQYQFEDKLTVDIDRNSINFSLSKLLDKYKGISDTIRSVKTNFPAEKIDSLFELKKMNIDSVLRQLPQRTEVSPYQVCFQVTTKLGGKSEGIGEISNENKQELLDLFFDKFHPLKLKYNENEVYEFDDFDPKVKILTNQEEYLLEKEKIPAWVKEWYKESAEKKEYLKQCGLKKRNKIIDFRKKYDQDIIDSVSPQVIEAHFYENTCQFITLATKPNRERLKNIGKLLKKYNDVNRRMSPFQIFISSDGYQWSETEEKKFSFISKYDDSLEEIKSVIPKLEDKSNRILDNRYAQIDPDVLTKNGHTEIKIENSPPTNFDRDKEEIDWEYYNKWKNEGSLNYDYEIFFIPTLIKLEKKWKNILIARKEKTYFSQINEQLEKSKKINKIYLYKKDFEKDFLTELEKVIEELALNPNDFIKLQKEYINAQKESVDFIEEKGGIEKLRKRLEEEEKKVTISEKEAVINKNEKDKFDEIKSVLGEHLGLLLDNLAKIKKYLKNIDEADEDVAINLITGYVGEVVFDWYLKQKDFHYNYVAETIPAYDFEDNLAKNVIDVKSTSQSLTEASNKSLPFYIKESQYTYLKKKANDQIYNIARMSIKDVGLNPLARQYAKNNTQKEFSNDLKKEIKKEVEEFLNECPEKNQEKIKKAFMIFRIEDSSL